MKKSILAVAVFATFMGGAYAADVIHTESTFTSTQSVSESTHRYTAENITMTANSGDDVVLAGKAGKIYIGDDQTKTVSITAKEGVGYDAVSAFASGEKNTGNLVEIKATDSIVIESSANGLWGQSNDQQAAGSRKASKRRKRGFSDVSRTACFRFIWMKASQNTGRCLRMNI